MLFFSPYNGISTLFLLHSHKITLEFLDSGLLTSIGISTSPPASLLITSLRSWMLSAQSSLPSVITWVMHLSSCFQGPPSTLASATFSCARHQSWEITWNHPPLNILHPFRPQHPRGSVSTVWKAWILVPVYLGSNSSSVLVGRLQKNYLIFPCL